MWTTLWKIMWLMATRTYKIHMWWINIGHSDVPRIAPEVTWRTPGLLFRQKIWTPVFIYVQNKEHEQEEHAKETRRLQLQASLTEVPVAGVD